MRESRFYSNGFIKFLNRIDFAISFFYVLWSIVVIWNSIFIDFEYFKTDISPLEAGLCIIPIAVIEILVKIYYCKNKNSNGRIALFALWNIGVPVAANTLMFVFYEQIYDYNGVFMGGVGMAIMRYAVYVMCALFALVFAITVTVRKVRAAKKAKREEKEKYIYGDEETGTDENGSIYIRAEQSVYSGNVGSVYSAEKHNLLYESVSNNLQDINGSIYSNGRDGIYNTDLYTQNTIELSPRDEELRKERLLHPRGFAAKTAINLILFIVLILIFISIGALIYFNEQSRRDSRAFLEKQENFKNEMTSRFPDGSGDLYLEAGITEAVIEMVAEGRIDMEQADDYVEVLEYTKASLTLIKWGADKFNEFSVNVRPDRPYSQCYYEALYDGNDRVVYVVFRGTYSVEESSYPCCMVLEYNDELNLTDVIFYDGYFNGKVY